MTQHPLPPGQRERADFPRFGMTAFAERAPADLDQVAVRCTGAVRTPWVLDAAALATLQRVEQVSDFHCVTSWSRRAQVWSGWRFAEVYRELIVPHAGASPEVGWIVLRSQDGYRALGPAFMSHDRARVALEERGRFVPNWLLRYLFRPLIGPTVAAFARASRRREG